MKEFPSKFNSSNVSNFKSYMYDRNMCYLRKDIYEFVLINDDVNNYFDITSFNNTYVHDTEITKKLINHVIIELKQLGWVCTLAYYDTGLFIYTINNIPSIIHDNIYSEF